jgi:hypothetical protein
MDKSKTTTPRITPRTPRKKTENPPATQIQLQACNEETELNDELSETIESSIHNSSEKQNYSVESCTWIRESMLKTFNRQKLDDNFPRGVSEQGEPTFVGKARIKLSQSGKITDKLGQVKKSRLEMCHLNKCHEFDKFVVLNFEKPSFYWHQVDSSSLSEKIPQNVVRLGYDTVTHSVLYAGRSTTTKNCKIIGYFSAVNNQLSVPSKNEALTLKTFECLCLKLNPMSLKNICRHRIREILQRDNSSIEKLRFFLEPSLIKFTKYSNSLKYGKELRRGESLVSKNGQFKLSIEFDGRLMYYPNSKDFIFLYEKVESLWFYELGLVVCFEDLRSTIFLDNLDNMNANFKDAKMVIGNNGALKIQAPLFEFKIIVQFRDYLPNSLNGSKPKFSFAYFFEKTSIMIAQNNGEMPHDSDFDSSDSESEPESSESSNNSQSGEATVRQSIEQIQL